MPVLIALNEPIFPFPLALKPIVGFVFVHVNVVLATLLLNNIALVSRLLQIVWLSGCVSIGVGFTVIITVKG